MSNKVENASVAVVLAGVVLVGVLFVGWGMNIYKLVSADFETPYKTEIVRAIGIFPLVGGVVGYMDIGEENNE